MRAKFQIAVLAVAAMFCLTSASRSFADSQIRIVRLSDVEGMVQVKRSPAGYEKAFVNLPIAQGNSVRTQEDGRAEIQFEDGSALRLAPETTVEFSQLTLADSGIRMSTAKLTSGTTYIDFKDSKNGVLTLLFGREKIVLTRPAHFRIELSDSAAAVAVFRDVIEVQTPSENIEVAKNRTAIVDLSGDHAEKIARNVDQDPYDAWDRKQDEYQQRFSQDATVASTSSPYVYGWSDLSYYGSYFNAPGYGLMWQPYFAGAGWNPFMDGGWALFPGAGYGWVSAYPWGWTPYHSGSWVAIPGRGWAWQPGSTWTAVNSSPRVLNAPAGFSAPKAPVISGQAFISVGHGAAPTLAGHSTSKLIIQNNSAGLGIPRGGINNLAAVSERAGNQGVVTARVHTAPVLMPPMSMSGVPVYPGEWRPMSSSQRGSAAPSVPAGAGVHAAPIGRGKN